MDEKDKESRRASAGPNEPLEQVPRDVPPEHLPNISTSKEVEFDKIDAPNGLKTQHTIDDKVIVETEKTIVEIRVGSHEYDQHDSHSTNQAERVSLSRSASTVWGSATTLTCWNGITGV